MLEDVAGARWSPPLIEQLRLHQLRKPLLERGVVQRRQGFERGIGKLPPQHGAQLRHFFAHRVPIQPRHQRILQRGGNGQGG